MNDIKIIKTIKHPQNIFLALGKRGFFNFMRDETYLKLFYYCQMGRKLNLKNPTTYNEKLQWLKLNDRSPQYTIMADKYAVRKYIADKIGEKYLIPLLGVWDDPEEIDFDSLPNKFVLKCAHNSGGIVICRDKGQLDVRKTKKILRRYLRYNYYWLNREWPYRDIKPRIVAEQYMVDESGAELKDYKFFCFNGEAKAMYVASNRGSDTRFDFFDLEFNHMPFVQYYPNADKTIDKPKSFNKMVKMAESLSEGILQIRVDFYDINGRIYFGEFTFFHFSGTKKFEPFDYDELFGSWLELD